ncbi:peptidoglycan-binding protein [Streptomyces sp. NPDC051561]|uniref:peptidoglycan-binding protein n=1 Tax=Streptomyces sp. NPDC051561 TaxID=3365658 RepID=UPI00379BF30B
MSRWKALPSQLGERDRQLVVQLRRLKDHSGLSLAALESRTASSRSSWERYLNGRTPAPREAVGELARVCGSDPTRLLVLHDVAAREREGRARGLTEEGVPDEGVPEGGVPEGGLPKRQAPGQPQEPPAGGPSTRTLPLGPPLLSVLALALLVGLAAGYALAEAARDEAADPGSYTYTYREGRTYPCGTGRKDGGLYAGHSVSRDALLMPNTEGWDVVEAQCLLRHHGLDPGTADGLYGTRAEDAVKAFQRRHKLVVDGIVGENTWRELRR